MGVAGIIMVAFAFALFYAPWSYTSYIDVARESPRHFMMRLGAIFFMLSVVWFVENFRKPEANTGRQWRTRPNAILSVLGQESLFIYGFHLLIVYGSQFSSHNIARDVGRVLTYVPSFGITILVVLLSSAIALGWHWAKNQYPRQAKMFFYSLCAVYFAVFLLN